MRKSKLIKNAAILMSILCMAGAVAGCGEKKTADNTATDASVSKEITVVSREDGSGTRGAFIELFGIEEKDANGNKVDNTTDEAITSSSTEVMMTTVAGNDSAIGYTSLGALNSNVKALKVDGAEATVDNVKSGTYKVSRPFNIATKENISEVTQDFINYILSSEGQKVVEDKGYISEGNRGEFKSNGASGKVVITGSSSVTPVMEKLAEAYQKINTNATIEISQTDSSAGMTSVAEGSCDIGMASREIKDSELAKGIKGTKIALDGIAVIVNNANELTDITSEQVKSIFTGKTTNWSDVK